MFDVFYDALIDTAKMAPFLFFIYGLIEFIEYKYGSSIRDKVKNAGKTGPLFGALFGIIPQCGFSVISAALYSQRLISLGVLLAVFLSTSDEAIPIILSQPEKTGVLLPILSAKLIIAVSAGYVIDLTMARSGKASVKSEIAAADDEYHHRTEDTGCCGHNCTSEKPNMKEIIMHPIIHTLKVVIFLFIISLAINLIIFEFGEQNLGQLLLRNSIFQPLVVALIGLIPNCASSVAITEVFLNGGISMGSAIGGLSSGAGLGLLVLIRENRSIKDTIKIIGILYGISAMAGIIIQTTMG